MDLPSCPSCHQSVLDDDAEFCPFCGASMKGGPASKPRPATAAPTTPAASKSASAKAPQSPVKSAAAAKPDRPATQAPLPVGDDDDPFAVDPMAGRDAIPVSRQRTQSKPLKVQCPMCEAVGYVPTTAAGREVRCANPECRMPVFTAPKPVKKVEAPPPPKPKFPAAIIAALATIAVAGGGGLWWYMSPKAPPPTKVGATTAAPVKSLQTKKEDTTEAPVAPVERPITLANNLPGILETMTAATAEQNRNRSKQYCLRGVAETAADCGDLKTSRENIELLEKQAADAKYYVVAPLTSIAWQELAAGDKPAAAKTIAAALEAARDLPTQGRYSLDVAAKLAATLIAVDRLNDAKAVVERHPAADMPGRLSAALVKAAAWRTYDPAREDADAAFHAVGVLQPLAAIEMAVSLGAAAEALRFAQAIPDEKVRNEGLLAWGEAVTRSSLSQSMAASAGTPPVDASLEKLPPSYRARLDARRGLVQLRAGDRTAAEASLKKALATATPLSKQAEYAFPSLADVHDARFPNDVALRSDGLAYAEIARLAGRLDKQADALKYLADAMGALRAAGPSPVAVDERIRQVDQENAARFRTQLQAALKITNDDKARAAVSQYRRNLEALRGIAQLRFAAQTAIALDAYEWADRKALWAAIKARATDPDVNRREPYFGTILPWRLGTYFLTQKDTPAFEEIRDALSKTSRPSMTALDEALSKAGEISVQTAAQAIEAAQVPNESQRELAVLVYASRLVHAGKVDEAISFVRRFSDALLREEAIEWTSALAARTGPIDATYKTLKQATFVPTESVAAWRGFLLGLAAKERKPAANVAAR